MAKAYITEYRGLRFDANGYSMAVPEEPPVATQVVDFTAGETKSALFNELTTVIRVHVDAICSRKVGKSTDTPTATTSDARMTAGQTEYLGVKGGSVSGLGQKISFISNT